MEEKDLQRDPLTDLVIGAGIEVHRILGPGLLESAYEECLEYARQQKGKLRELFTLDALVGQGQLLMMQSKYEDAMVSFTA